MIVSLNVPPQQNVYKQKIEIKNETSKALTVHLLHCPNKVLGVLEADEAVALALACALVPDHLGALERRELVEGARQQLVIDVVTQVAAKDAKIVVGPIAQRRIFPGLATGDAHRLKVK